MDSSANRWGGMVRAKRASTVATTTGALPAAIWCSAAKRLRSHSREETALGRNCHSLASSVTGVSPVRLCRSPASWRASRSSAQRNTMGRPAPAATAAPTQARCTGWVPVRTAGHPPFSTRLTSSATSGSVCRVFRNASIRHLLTKVMLYAQMGALRPWWPGCAAVFLCYYMPVRPVSYNRSWPFDSRFR